MRGASQSPRSDVPDPGVLRSGGATGGFILGKTNTETTTATLSNTDGTPLKLTAPAGTAPLAVNRTTMVTNLNDQYLSGFTYDQLAVQGGDGYELGDIPHVSGGTHLTWGMSPRSVAVRICEISGLTAGRRSLTLHVFIQHPES